MPIANDYVYFLLFTVFIFPLHRPAGSAPSRAQLYVVDSACRFFFNCMGIQDQVHTSFPVYRRFIVISFIALFFISSSMSSLAGSAPRGARTLLFS